MCDPSSSSTNATILHRYIPTIFRRRNRSALAVLQSVKSSTEHDRLIARDEEYRRNAAMRYHRKKRHASRMEHVQKRRRRTYNILQQSHLTSTEKSNRSANIDMQEASGREHVLQSVTYQRRKELDVAKNAAEGKENKQHDTNTIGKCDNVGNNLKSETCAPSLLVNDIRERAAYDYIGDSDTVKDKLINKVACLTLDSPPATK